MAFANVTNTIMSLGHDYDQLYKVVIIGQANVGKTSLIRRFVQDHFNETYDATIGVEFLTKNIAIENTTVKLNLWDTAGSERFQSIMPSYYRGADAVVLVYDISTPATVDGIERLYRDVEHYSGKDALPGLIIGNKSDLMRDNHSMVGRTTAQNIAERLDLTHFETSAKENVNVDSAFQQLAQSLVLASANLRQLDDSSRDDNLVDLSVRREIGWWEEYVSTSWCALL